MTDHWPPAESLERLLAGNRRFVADQLTHGSGYNRARREETAESQLPMAAVVACADSRVAPALFLDTGIGDLFVCRTAGNSAEPATVGSLEFAIAELQVPLIAVIGHSHCGAMQAAVQMAGGETDTRIFRGAAASPSLVDLVTSLKPAAIAARDHASDEHDVVDTAGRMNVEMTCDQIIERSPGLAAAVAERRLGIVGLWYELRSGAIDVVRALPADNNA